jgi:hypothetical protein
MNHIVLTNICQYDLTVFLINNQLEKLPGWAFYIGHMKRPASKDGILIKSGEEILSEICQEGLPDPIQGPNGWKFAIISNHRYSKNQPYFLIDQKGEEIGVSIDSIASSSIKADKKRIVFSTLIRDSE